MSLSRTQWEIREPANRPFAPPCRLIGLRDGPYKKRVKVFQTIKHNPFSTSLPQYVTYSLYRCFGTTAKFLQMACMARGIAPSVRLEGGPPCCISGMKLCCFSEAVIEWLACLECSAVLGPVNCGRNAPQGYSFSRLNSLHIQ